MNYVYEILKKPEAFAIVMNCFGEEVFRIPSTGLPKSDSGSMADENDIAGLGKYLKNIGVMHSGDVIKTFAQAESIDKQRELEDGLQWRKGGGLAKKELGGNLEQRSILQMLNQYEPLVSVEHRELAYHQIENETTREKSYFLEMKVSPETIAVLQDPVFMEQLVENFKSYGYSKGFSSLVYDVVLEEAHPHIIFHAIEILKA